MMCEWIEKKLADFCEVKGGKRLPKGVNLINENSGHPYIRIRDLTGKKVLQLNEQFEFVDEDTQRTISRYIVDADDILISIVGTIGLISIVGDTLHHANLTENCVKLTNIHDIDRQYLYYYLISEYGQNEIKRGTVGAVQPKLPIKNIQDITIRLPSDIALQKKIACILCALDSKIELNQRINDNLQRQAFALFDKLLSEAGEDTRTVLDYAQINPKRILVKEHIARNIDMSHLSTSGTFPSGWETKPYNGGMKFMNGDTLLARITPCLENGKTAFINFLNDGEVAFGSTEYIVLAPLEGIPPEFLYCLARYPKFVDYAVKNMNGSSGRQRVSADSIGQYSLPALSPIALKQFGDIAKVLFAHMRQNFFENLRLADLRDALLPKLMSGEIDVSEVRF